MLQVAHYDSLAAKLDGRPRPKPNGLEDKWPEPVALPAELPPVAPFDHELLPPALHRLVEDIAERMQRPPDFPAVAIMVVLASVIGRRCGIAPKHADDWIVVPNLWGTVIGRPGIMKSPPLAEILKPLQVLQARAMERFASDQADYQAYAMVAVEEERVAKESIRKLLREKKVGLAADRAMETVKRESDAPVCRRYVVNDSTVEKLGEILNENPNGILLFRDELNGYFRTLERQGHEADRAFYLECWSGDGSFTYDRIGRGTLHIAGACLSILGSIQPGPLSDLVRGLRGSGDDGVLQRFQLAVRPESSPKWCNVDRAPDREAREAVQRINRSLVPSLALVIHLTEASAGPVPMLALERAIAWVEYLESHARRIYAPAISPDVDAARALVRRIKAGDVASRFGLREVYNRGWSGLSTRNEVLAAVEVLIDHQWLRDLEEPTPGRPRTVYQVNPAVLPAERRS